MNLLHYIYNPVGKFLTFCQLDPTSTFANGNILIIKF